MVLLFGDLGVSVASSDVSKQFRKIIRRYDGQIITQPSVESDLVGKCTFPFNRIISAT